RAGALLGQAVLAKLDQLSMPSVALINGYAFGGGLELALACTFRLAAPSAKLGFPEIKLGLIPGYGGTQRLPRLVGEARATELILTGRTVEADEAERIGLINRIVAGDLVEAGTAFARDMTGFSLPVLCLARDAVRRRPPPKGGSCSTASRRCAATRSRRAPPATTGPASSRGTMSARSTHSALMRCLSPRPTAGPGSLMPPISPACARSRPPAPR